MDPVTLGMARSYADKAKVEKPALSRNSLTGWYHATGFSGIDPTGATDSTAGLNAFFDALPDVAATQPGATAYLPSGVYLCNTVTSGNVLRILSKFRITLRGGGAGVTIRTTTAVADHLLLVKDCPIFRMENILFQVIGTAAEIQKAVHVTVSSPGSASRTVLEKIYVQNNAAYRKVFDVRTVSGNATIWSAAAAFTAADVNAPIYLNHSEGPFNSKITAAATVTTTLSAAVTTTSQTSISLSSALSGAPSSGFTIQIDSERMYVTAGGNTTTLTVTRARGNKDTNPAATHSSGATVSTSYATMADNAIGSSSTANIPARIQAAGTSILYVGIAIGTDNPGASNMDIAGYTLTNCTVSRCQLAGVQVGNGTPGNVLDHRAYQLSAFECSVGLWLPAGGLSIHGGEMSVNLIDIKQISSSSQDLVFEGIRSEDAAMLYDCTGAATAGSQVALRNIECVNFHAEDNVVARHLTSRPITLEAVTLKNADSASGVYFSVAGTSSFPCSMVAINVSWNGQNSDLFPASTSVIRSVIACARMSTAALNYVRNSMFGTVLDNKFEARGGFARGRTTVANTNYTVLDTDFLVAYTSISAARAVTLPTVSSLHSGQEWTVKDESGSCSGSNTITISPASGTIDGASNVVLNTAYAKVTLYTNGTNWFTR